MAQSRLFPPAEKQASFPFGDEQVASSLTAAELVNWELNKWLNDLYTWYVINVDQLWKKWWVTPLTSQDTPFLSKTQYPYGHHAVETLIPRILGDDPTIDYTSMQGDIDDLSAVMNGALARWELKQMGFTQEARHFIRQGLVTGYSVAKFAWVREASLQDVTVHHEQPLNPKDPSFASVMVESTERQLVVGRNLPFFETVNIRDFAWPVYAKTLDDAPAVYQRRWMTKRQLEDAASANKNAAGQPVYQNLDRVAPIDGSRYVEAYNPQFAAQNIPLTMPFPPGDPDQGIVEVWERWANDRLTVIANRSVIIRDEPNPFLHKRKPFVDWAPIPRPFQMHGVGVMRLVDDQVEDFNALLRQQRDALTYTINPMLKVPTGYDRSRLVMQPGGVIETDDPDDVAPLVQPAIDLSGAAVQMQQILQNMDRTTGAYDLYDGAFGLGGMRSATGVQTLFQEATRRALEMQKNMEERMMRRLAKLLLSYHGQFVDQELALDFTKEPDAAQAWMRFVGAEQPPEGMVRVPAAWLRPSGVLEPVADVGSDKLNSQTQRRSDATQLVQGLAPVLANPMNPINMSGLAKYVMEQFDVPPQDIQQILQTPHVQQQAMQTAALPTGQTSGPSGPSGDQLPTGGVVGTPGAAGGSGAPRARLRLAPG